MRLPAPYTDPILNSARLYRGLVGRLVQRNLLSFSSVRRATFVVFTVAKKLDEQGIEWLRLIFDCRQVDPKSMGQDLHFSICFETLIFTLIVDALWFML